VFHHAQGLTPGVRKFADGLRSLPDYDEVAATLLMQRVLKFLEKI
jgi:hypothetical protein